MKNNADCVEEGFQLARTKLHRNGEGRRKPLGVGNFSSNINQITSILPSGFTYIKSFFFTITIK